MPQLALAAASFTTAATAASISTVTTAAAATAAKATLMATLKSVAMNVLTNVAISAAMSVLQPQVGAAGRPFEFVIDPDGPIPFAAGRIGVAGSVIHRDTFGPDLMFYGIPAVLSGAGPITAIESVKADDYPMAFDANGGATTEPYRQEFYFRSVLGEQPAPLALSTPAGLKNGATLPGWGASHKLSGKAAFLMVMAENSKGSAFPTGEVKPLVTLRGLKVYDPRKDSTYPGGDGPQRLGDPSTWTYSANPILWALKWCLGLWEGPNGKGAPQVDFQVGGIGAKPSGIDFPAFVAAANVSDANGWTVAAYPNTDDDKSQVLDGFLQAGGCVYAQRAGKISCIQRAAPRVSVVTISAADTAGPLEIDTAASRIDRINTLRPRFWSEAHRWQMTALDGEITAQAYRDEDGAARTRGLDFPFVSNARQCGQLAALQIANTREGIAGIIPLKPHMQRVRPGDAFTITEPGFVLNGVKCLCLNTDYDPATGVVRVSFVSETDAKYPFALGQNPTPPAPQVLTPVDPGFVSPPEAGDWTIIVRPPSPGGSQLPGFDLTGIVSNSTATAIIVEWGLPPVPPPPEPIPEGKVWADYVTWTTAYQGPPTVTKIPIDGLQPGASYYVAIQYQRNQNYSARQVYGPYTAPALIGDVMPNAPGLSQIKADIEAAFGGIFDVSGLLADARADIDAQGVEIAAARGGQPNLNSRILELNQAQIDGDEANAQAISLVQARTENTEADIIDLANAQATESDARAEAISQVNARLAVNPNLQFNPSFGSGRAGWFGSTYWTPQSNRLGSFAAFDTTAQADGSIHIMDAATPFTTLAPGERVTLAADVWVSDKPGASDARTAIQIVFRNSSNGADVGGSDVSWSDVTGYGNVVRKWTTVVAPNPTDGTTVTATTRTYIVGRISGGLRAIKAETGGVATTYSDDATVLNLSASVTEQSLAIIDLELNAAAAGFRKIAEASGSAPAYYEFVSSTSGGYAAIAGPVVALVNTSPGGGPPIVAMEAIDGNVRFGNDVRIPGDLVVLGTIDTPQLKNGAVSKGASAASTTETNVGLDTWTDLLSVAMTTSGGEVSIDFGAQVSAVNAAGPNAAVEVRFLRDGTVLETLEVMDLFGAQTVYVQGGSDPFQTYIQINTIVSSYIHPFTVDTGASAAAHTWKVQLRSQAGATVGAKKMRIQEMKR